MKAISGANNFHPAFAGRGWNSAGQPWSSSLSVFFFFFPQFNTHCTFFYIFLLQFGTGAGMVAFPPAFTVTDSEVASKTQQRGPVQNTTPLLNSTPYAVPAGLVLDLPFSLRTSPVKRLLAPEIRGYCVLGPWLKSISPLFPRQP